MPRGYEKHQEFDDFPELLGPTRMLPDPNLNEKLVKRRKLVSFSCLSMRRSTAPRGPAAGLALEEGAIADHGEIAAFGAGFADIAPHARFRPLVGAGCFTVWSRRPANNPAIEMSSSIPSQCKPKRLIQPPRAALASR